MLDPAANPFFFAYSYLSLNSEFWFYSKLIRSMLMPITNGIHKQSDRSTIVRTNKVIGITKTVLVADLFTRVLFMSL